MMKTFYKLLIILFLVWGSEYGLFAQGTKKKPTDNQETNNTKKTDQVSSGKAETLKIYDVTEKNIVALVPASSNPENYTISEIYDIYKISEVVADECIYTEFIDSIYLAKIEKNKLTFNYIWDGEQKYLSRDYLLYPTGRKYLKETEQISRLIENDKFSSSDIILAALAGGFVTVYTASEEDGVYEQTSSQQFSAVGARLELLAMLGNYRFRLGVDTGFTFGIGELELGFDYYFPFSKTFGLYLGGGVLPPFFSDSTASTLNSSEHIASICGNIGLLIFINNSNSELLNKLMIDITLIKAYATVLGNGSSGSYCAGVAIGYHL